MTDAIVTVEWWEADAHDPCVSPHYRDCSFCQYCATDDIGTVPKWNPDVHSRTFHQHIPSGMTACSECYEELLKAIDEP